MGQLLALLRQLDASSEGHRNSCCSRCTHPNRRQSCSSLVLYVFSILLTALTLHQVTSISRSEEAFGRARMTIWWKLSYSVEGRGITLEGCHYRNLSLSYTWRPPQSSIGRRSDTNYLALVCTR
jgi:hypothetical protein